MARPARFGPQHRRRLHALARASVEHGLQHGRPAPVEHGSWPAALLQPAASFVTLKLDARLRGCIGSIEASRPLVEDIAHNAWAAAFRDPRFGPCGRDEVTRLHYELSVLGPQQAITAASAAALCACLQPRIDGLIIAARGHRGVYLPQVWDQLPEPQDFLKALLRKAGLPEQLEPPELQAWRFQVEHF